MSEEIYDRLFKSEMARGDELRKRYAIQDSVITVCDGFLIIIAELVKQKKELEDEIDKLRAEIQK